MKVNDNNEIIELVEKPTEFVSDLAIIGIYYFKNGEQLQKEMQYLIDHEIKEKGEYQFTTALERMKKAGAKFIPGQVEEWLDCGNKDAMVDTNKRYLEFIKDQQLVSPSLKQSNAVIIPPCFIGEGVVIENSVIGPHVSIGDYTIIGDSRVTNSIIQKNCTVRNAVLDNSMLGNFVNFEGKSEDLSLGDYSTN